LTFDVFEHVQDPPVVLSECRRVLKEGGKAFIVFPSFFQPIEHHLGLVTRAPFIHYVFPPQALIAAYYEMIAARGPEAAWYARESDELEPWERGNTINGLTIRRFRRLAAEAGFTIEAQARKPIGSVGRRSETKSRGRRLAGALTPVARLPLVEEMVLHRGTFILKRR
jgi:SAM-dependent methyltransferase